MRPKTSRTGIREGIIGVDRQPSNRLKFNRQQAIFTVNSKKSKQLFLAVKEFQRLSNITISAARPERLPFNWETSFHVPKVNILTLWSFPLDLRLN